jgi:RNA polymerase sigma-70 factor (ECF subfamily)
MLGSLHEAEDLIQETLLRAWRSRHTYEGRAPLRAWLYRIATNLCLDALRQRPRRGLPVGRQGPASLDEPVPASVMEPIWLEPFPDDLLPEEDANPEARYTQRESVALAFMTSLQLLPPRQRAVLILRDVLDWPAAEVAEWLGQSVPAVKSALHRARSTLAGQAEVERPAPAPDERLRVRLEQYVRAWEDADVDGLAALLKADATFSMPPIPAWYQGRETIAGLVAKTVFAGPARGCWRLLPTRANGRLAFGLYRVAASGGHAFYGIQVLKLDRLAVADVTTFRAPSLAKWFNLPERI